MDKAMLDKVIEGSTSMIRACILWAENAEPLVKAAALVEKVFGKTDNEGLVMNNFTSTGNVHLYIQCKSFEEAAPVVKLLTHACNLHQKQSMVQSGLTVEYTFEQRKEDKPLAVEHYNSVLKLMVDISKGPCKLVQVGSKTIEQPIFEMRCGDEPAETPKEADEENDDVPL